MNEKIAIRDAYGQALRDLGSENPRVVALEADVGSSSRSILFGKEFPERYFNVGISELNMVNMAAGLALEGFVPYVNTFAVFMASRSLDPVQSLIAYDNLNVRLCGTYSGLSDSYDGASHQAITDIAAMRSIPNMTVINVCDAVQTRKAVFALADFKGPAYLRLSRAPAPVLYGEDAAFEIGKGVLLREGKDVAIFATGTVLHSALAAADLLAKEGIQAAVADIHTIQPLDKELVVSCARATGAVLTVEEHSVRGGLGSAVAQCLAEACPTVQDTLGCTEFAESGDLDLLLEKYGFSPETIALRAKNVMDKRG